MFFEAVGWRITEIPESQLNKKLREKEKYCIAELRNTDKIYIIRDFPRLSKQEHEVIERAFEELLELKKSPATISMKSLIAEFCEKNLIELEKDQLEYLSRVLESTVNGFGVFDNFLANENIEEIAVNGAGKKNPVFVYEKNFGWLASNAFFSRKENVLNLANKMAMKIGRQLGSQTPLLNAFLPDGSRLNACMPPVSAEPTITIRKFSKTPFTPLDLLNKKTISPKALAFLWLAMQTDLSAVISGNTGSGKTTTLNSLFSFVPKNERIVVAEETPEIRLCHPHVARLKTVEQIGVLMNEIVTNTLRMRPDRVIVGEVRTR
ncbi:MAG: ATPase, T2SS/T4P/T4SS family, partial [archaeon]|nr:ATPase, T2SS/T4P/T4SS family [archaeon]